MKYKENSELWYVCPFLFTIERVKVVMAVKENDHIFYIDEETGAYLAEWNLFDNLSEAKGDAIKKLNKLYAEVIRRTMNYGEIENRGECL